MALKVLYTGRDRRGTPVPDVKNMVWYAHPEVEFASWNWNSELNYKDQSDNLYNILKG